MTRRFRSITQILRSPNFEIRVSRRPLPPVYQQIQTGTSAGICSWTRCRSEGERSRVPALDTIGPGDCSYARRPFTHPSPPRRCTPDPTCGRGGWAARKRAPGSNDTGKWRCEVVARSGAGLGSRTVGHGCEEHASVLAGRAARAGWEMGPISAPSAVLRTRGTCSWR